MQRHHRTDLGPRFNEGARQLWLALEARGITHAKAARALGWDRATATRALYGDVLPRIGLLVEVNRAFGVDLALWAIPPVEPFIPPAAREEEEAEQDGAA